MVARDVVARDMVARDMVARDVVARIICWLAAHHKVAHVLHSL